MIKTATWTSISPSQFEELVFWLLHREGFFNVAWYGEAGGDKGRDIVCQRSDLFGPRVMFRNCIVQCKRYKGRVARARLFEDILKASEHNPDCFILATTGIMGASTKDWLTTQEQHLPYKLVLWERMDLDILLERHQDIRAKFLGIPVDPGYLLTQVAQESQVLASVDKILLTAGVRRCVTTAYNLALKHSHLVTLGHLLVGLLREDRVCTRPLFLSLTIDPGKLANVLEEAFVKQDEASRMAASAPQISVSVRTGLETAVRVRDRLGEATISERILLMSLILQPFSGTMQFLEYDCRINRDDLLQSLVRKFFTEEQRPLLLDHMAIGSSALAMSSRRADLDTMIFRLGPAHS